MEAAGLLWFGAFTLTGMWFWAVVMAWVVATFTDIHRERPGWATVWLILFLAVLHLGGAVDVLHLVWTSPWAVLGAVGGYITIGLVWAVFKFKFWLRKQRIFINEKILPICRLNFLERRQVAGGVIPPDLQALWRREQLESPALRSAIKSMEVGENKSRLTMWAIWWPISMIWTVISDWVTEMFNWLIFDLLGGFLHRMVDSEKSKIAAD